MVEHCRFGSSRRPCVVVRGNDVQELGTNGRFQRHCPLLDQAQAEMDMAEQAPFLGRAEGRPAGELDRAADIVQEGAREQQIGSEPRMELRELAADRRDTDGVLEQAARVAVMAVDRRRQSPQACTQLIVQYEAADGGLQARVRDLTCQELEKSLQLVSVSTQGRRECLGIEPLCRLERADLELKAVAETVDSAENAHGVAFGEATVEQVDIAPDARLDASARVDKLECQVRRAGARAQLLLLRDRVDALDDSVVLELRDCGHRVESRPEDGW